MNLSKGLTSPVRWSTALLLAALALGLGVLVTLLPEVAIGVTALVVVTLLAFRAPVTHLTILLALTTIVPYSILNRYSPGGGTGSAGLLVSDLFLITGLLRVALVLPQMRLDRRRLTVVALVVGFVGLTSLEFLRGLWAGHTPSDAGAELRALGGGFAAALIGLTLLNDPEARRRILRALLVLGLALGVWGVAQWVLQIGFSGDFGVRAGVGLTSSGRGQIQGGLFAFPVAVILASAALASGRVRSHFDLGLVLLVLGLNAVSLLLTFERTFWVATAAGVLLVALRSGRARRARALLWIAVTATCGLLTLSAVAPGEFRTAQERLFSIGKYRTDNSVRYRTVESGFVIDKIREKPVLGWGLADTIYWGQPWTSTLPAEQSYTHVGYLWLTWRLGVIGAGMLLALLILAALWPGRAAAGGLGPAMRTGCQASLLALLIANLTFPLFQSTQITFLMGFLVAYSALPVVSRQRLPAFGPSRVHVGRVGSRAFAAS
jgi:O-antigen ligase